MAIMTGRGTGRAKAGDAAAATVTANFRGVPITHPLPAAGAAWAAMGTAVRTMTAASNAAAMTPNFR